MTFETARATFDTLLALYTGSSYGALSLAAAADEGSRYLGRSRVSFSTVAGTTYRIAVDGKVGATGTVGLTWDYAGKGVDFDGDGRADRSVYRNGAWFVDGQPTSYLGTGTDIPVPADSGGPLASVEPAEAQAERWLSRSSGAKRQVSNSALCGPHAD